MILQFVFHHKIPEFESRGWVVVNDMADSHHGYYSVIMELPDEDEGGLNLQRYTQAGCANGECDEATQ